MNCLKNGVQTIEIQYLFKKTDCSKAVDRIIGASTKYNGDFYYFNIKVIVDANEDDNEDDEPKSALDM